MKIMWPNEYDLGICSDPEVRARALLFQHLSPKQRAQFRKSREFTVRGSVSRRKYRITYGRSHNVIRGPKTFCATTTDYRQPISDQLLAQKVLLENDEMKFLHVANASFGKSDTWTLSQLWCASFGMVAILLAALYSWGLIP